MDYMRVRWHGHACFEFEDDGVTVVVDPHDGKSIGIRPPVANANVVLMTHDHYDHNASRVIRGNHVDFKFAYGTHICKGFAFQGFKSFHDECDGAKRGMNTIYKFEMDGITVCHCGDIGAMPSDEVIAEMRGCDMMFVPAGEIYTLGVDEVKVLIEKVNPKIVVPMHYRIVGLSIPLAPVDKLLSAIPDDYTNYVGNEVDISADELPDVHECWVFSPQ